MNTTWIAAGAALLLCAGAAHAQEQNTPPAITFTTACTPLPAAPAIPDGSTANIRQMMAAEPIVQTWSTTYLDAMACRKKELEALDAQLMAALRVRDASKAAYDAEARAYQAISADWTREGEEYQARRGGQRK